MSIPLYKPFLAGEEISRVTEVLKRESYWVNGPEIAELEKRVSQITGSKYAVSFNSGTSGLHGMMVAHGIGQGDEVIVPAFSFISTANAPLFVGAKPVFADIESKTYSLDPDDIRKRITSKTKAILPIHYGGIPALKIAELHEIAEEKGILLLEDAAESLGATLDGKPVGSFGDSAMFSFCGNKIVTSGEGGIVVTDDDGIYEKLKLVRSHGRFEKGDYFAGSEEIDYVTLGYNFRMPSIVAALALAQVNALDKIISLRKKVAKLYDREFEGLPVYLPPDGGKIKNVYQMYSVLFDSNSKRNTIKNVLAKQNIGNRVYFDPIYNYSFFKPYKTSLKVTDDVSMRILSIPIYPAMSEEEVLKVASVVKNQM